MIEIMVLMLMKFILIFSGMTIQYSECNHEKYDIDQAIYLSK